ncbi:MAG: CotH kinase family protein [Clostridia bacterium]|nr:CotH kinase family protein [Clostridia bacterium]
MKFIKTSSLMILVMLCLLFTLSGCGESHATSGVPSDAFDVCEVGVEICGEIIRVQKNMSGDGYTLYLPAFCDGVLWSLPENLEQITLSGKEIRDGESAQELTSAESVIFKSGEAEVEVRVLRSANIPALFLHSDDGNMDKINSSPDHSYGTAGEYSLISSDGAVLSSGALKKLRGRGNSTWNGTAKKPYQMELKSSESLLGLAKAKKYVLLANYYDPSLLRNSVAFSLAKVADGFSPNFAPVDLYACGEYIGSYLLCDKIDIDEEKIDIINLEELTEDILEEDPDTYERGGAITGAEHGSYKWYELPEDPKDISGGFVLEVDYPERYPDEVSGFVTERGLPIVIVSPECASKAQVEYIKEYVGDFEDALYSEDGYNEKGKHYSAYVDMDSLVFRYLFEEFTLNIDACVSSFHIYKDSDTKDGKLNFSCVWDYDCTFGNYNLYADLTSPETLFVASSETRNSGTMPSWLYALLGHEDFVLRVKEYYTEAFAPAAREALSSITDKADEIAKSAYMDDALYSGADNKNFFGADSGENFDEAVIYLTDFIEKRIEFFDKTFGDANQ